MPPSTGVHTRPDSTGGVPVSGDLRRLATLLSSGLGLGLSLGLVLGLGLGLGLGLAS